MAFRVPAKKRPQGLRRDPTKETEGVDAQGGEEEEGEDKAGSGALATSKRRKPSESTPSDTQGIHEWRRGEAQAASREMRAQRDALASAQRQDQTPHDRDARAIREKALEKAATGENQVDDGVYRGQYAYTDWRKGFRREQSASSDQASKFGPQRAPSNVRTSYEIDFNPPICKVRSLHFCFSLTGGRELTRVGEQDWKETGFCGYGDSCKFLHDRSDYKAGWQLEQDWQRRQKEKEDRQRKAAERMARRAEQGKDPDGEEEEEEENEEEQAPSDLPFACYICRKSFMEVNDPVVTKCKHYFCQECALRRHQVDRTCAACGNPTQGVFNAATEILDEVKRRKRGEKPSRRHQRKSASGREPELPRQGQHGWLLG